MKVKTLRFKDSKEFVHIMEDGGLATSSQPNILAETANIESLKEYLESHDFAEGIDFDNLEMIDYYLINSDEIGADIRNKLSPPKNLVTLLEKYFDTMDTGEKIKLLKYIQDSMEETKKSVDYLSKLL